MEKNGKHNFIAQIAGPGLVLAALLALMLSNPGIGRAQAGTASPAVTSAKPAEAASRTPTPLAAKPQAKGQNEGIHVHGHWTIVVRNPDGKLVTHREFENGLSTINGAGFLAALLGRVVTPGGWQVELMDSAQQNAIIIAEANSTISTYCPATLKSSSLDSGSCSSNLTLTGPQEGGQGITGGSLTLAGSGTVPQGFPAAIGAVFTQNAICAPSASAQTCFTSVNTIDYPQLTFRNLDSVGTDPAPVPVTAGQTVSVTVVISFTSGS
jgi:hypothetical protein